MTVLSHGSRCINGRLPTKIYTDCAAGGGSSEPGFHLGSKRTYRADEAAQ
jgi:hypothetical protein